MRTGYYKLKKAAAVVLIGLFLVGCTKEEKQSQVIWGEHYTRSNAYLLEGESCRLIVPFAYQGEYETVRLVSVTGENAEDAEIDLNYDKEWDALEGCEYQGYYLGIAGLQIVPKGSEKVSVETMTVMLDDEEYTVHFSEPITYIPAEPSEDIGFGTSTLMLSSVGACSLRFDVVAYKDVTLNGYELCGEYKEIADVSDSETEGSSCRLVYNGKNLNGSEQLELKKGETATYRIDVKPDDPYAFSYNNFIVYYQDQNGEQKSYVFGYLNQWVSGPESAQLLLEMLVDEYTQ